MLAGASITEEARAAAAGCFPATVSARYVFSPSCSRSSACLIKALRGYASFGMWEQLQQRIQLRLDQMRKHPELILLYSLAFVGYILTMKEANKQLGRSASWRWWPARRSSPIWSRGFRGARSIELPDEKDDGAAPLGFLRSSA